MGSLSRTRLAIKSGYCAWHFVKSRLLVLVHPGGLVCRRVFFLLTVLGDVHNRTSPPHMLRCRWEEDTLGNLRYVLSEQNWCRHVIPYAEIPPIATNANICSQTDCGTIKALPTGICQEKNFILIKMFSLH